MVYQQKYIFFCWKYAEEFIIIVHQNICSTLSAVVCLHSQIDTINQAGRYIYFSNKFDILDTSLNIKPNYSLRVSCTHLSLVVENQISIHYTVITFTCLIKELIFSDITKVEGTFGVIL